MLVVLLLLLLEALTTVEVIAVDVTFKALACGIAAGLCVGASMCHVFDVCA